MLRLAHVFFVIQSLHVIVDSHASNAFVAFVTSAHPPSPSPLNCMTNLRNERNHIFEGTFPSFKPNVTFKFAVTSTIVIFLLFRIFLHLCTTVKYVAFTTNLTLLTSMYHSEVRCIYNKLNPFTSMLYHMKYVALALLTLFGLLFSGLHHQWHNYYLGCSQH